MNMNIKTEVAAEEYEELLRAFTTQKEREAVDAAIGEALPSPLSFAILAVQRRASSLIKKVGSRG